MSWRALAAGAAFLAWLAASTPLGCRQLAGIEERSACEGITPSGSADCTECIAQSCCEAATACANDAKCVRVRDCLEVCAGDPTCESDCRYTHRSDLEGHAVAFLSCRARSCADPCAQKCGPYLYPTTECATCGQKCCAEALACGESEACLGLAACAWGCAKDDLPCRGDCQRRYPEGEDASRLLAQCLEGKCVAACFPPFLKPNWTCAPAEPLDKELSVELHLRNGYANLARTVSLCPRADPVCTTNELTSTGGKVQLTIPPGFDGYLYDHGNGGIPAITDFGARLGQLAEVDVPIVFYERKNATQWKGWFKEVAALEPEKGFIFLHSVDCDEVPQVVTYALEPLPGGASPFYGATGELGDGPSILGNSDGGFLNLDEGAYTVTVYDDTGGCVARVATYVVAGTETFIDGIQPSPCE